MKCLKTNINLLVFLWTLFKLFDKIIVERVDDYMATIILLAIAILPVYGIGYYIYQNDKEKEPRKLLRKLFLFGMLSCIPAAIIEVFIEPMFGVAEERDLILWFIYVALDVAIIEEFVKWFVVKMVAYNDKAFDHRYDAVIYAVFVSLGFACFENIFYVLSEGFKVGLFRAVTSIPGHCVFAIIMGDFFGQAKLADIAGDKQNKQKYLIASIIFPTFAHTIYDYCIMTENYFLIGCFFLFLIFIYVYGIKKVKKLSSIPHDLFGRDTSMVFNFCPHCGSKSQGKFCASCGTKLTIEDSNEHLTH